MDRLDVGGESLFSGLGGEVASSTGVLGMMVNRILAMIESEWFGDRCMFLKRLMSYNTIYQVYMDFHALKK